MLARRCRHRVIYFHWRPRSRDPDDDFLVELSASGCDCCATCNLRDWPAGGQALREALAAYRDREYLAVRAARADEAAFAAVLAKVPAVEPEAHDRR